LLSLLAGVETLNCMENQSCVGFSSHVTKCASLAASCGAPLRLVHFHHALAQGRGTAKNRLRCALTRSACCSTYLTQAAALTVWRDCYKAGRKISCCQSAVGCVRSSTPPLPSSRLVCAHALLSIGGRFRPLPNASAALLLGWFVRAHCESPFFLYVRSRSSCAASLVRQVCAA
jgi:hypothetical protein